MKKTVRVFVVCAIAAGLFPPSLFAQSASKSFQVSCTIPERIALDMPSRLHRLESRPEALLLRTDSFKSGAASNVGKNIDVGFVEREIAGQRLRIFTLTVL